MRRFWVRALEVLLVSVSAASFATDCDTDCEGHFGEWYQGPDLMRCLTEKEVACRTGYTNCDLFNVPVVDQLYASAQYAVEDANRSNNWPKTPSDCHGMVDGVATAGSGLGGLKFMKNVYDLGIKAAGTNAASLAGFASAGAVEVAKAFAHCACKHASYIDLDDTRGKRTTHDIYQVSLFGKNGGYSVYSGANDPDNRATLEQLARDALGQPPVRRISSTFASDRRTLTEAICKEGTFWKIENGRESINGAKAHVKEKGWGQCLFRTVNWVRNEAPVLNDRVYVSVTKDYSWRLRTGAKDRAEEVQNDAISKLGGNPDFRRRGYFSTDRPTHTSVSCESPSETSGQLQTIEGGLFVTTGWGYESIQRAINRAEKKFPRAWCRFDVSDSGFGPVPEFDFK